MDVHIAAELGHAQIGMGSLLPAGYAGEHPGKCLDSGLLPADREVERHLVAGATICTH